MPQRNHESVEWCQMRWHDAGDRDRRRVLLLGDSITGAYSYAAAIEFRPLATYSVLATSRALDDPNLQRETQYIIEHYRYDVIHFNSGIHGEHLDVAEYADGLRRYIELLGRLAPSARLSWGATTPICLPGTVDPHPEKNAIVLARNAAAAEIMNSLGIPVTDLYSLVLGRDDFVGKDGTHFREEGSIFLGQTVGRRVRELLEQQCSD